MSFDIAGGCMESFHKTSKGLATQIICNGKLGHPTTDYKEQEIHG